MVDKLRKPRIGPALPAGTKDLPTETNIKALMYQTNDVNGNPLGTTTYWVHDPSQDNSNVGDDIVITTALLKIGL